MPDLSSLRDRFPALAREVGGRPAVFVDAPGGSQVPATVIEAMAAYLRSSNANTHGAFATSRETDALIAEAHAAAADLLNADADEVFFGPNATTHRRYSPTVATCSRGLISLSDSSRRPFRIGAFPSSRRTRRCACGRTTYPRSLKQARGST